MTTSSYTMHASTTRHSVFASTSAAATVPNSGSEGKPYILHIMNNVVFFFSGLQLTIQWAITGVLVPVSIISTALVCALFFWLLVRKLTRRQQEAIHSLQSSSRCPTCDKQGAEKDKTVTIEAINDLENSTRKSEHVYSVPRWSRDSNASMLYNEAYQSDFSITINAAYSSTTSL